jgi:hypothetical protein
MSDKGQYDDWSGYITTFVYDASGERTAGSQSSPPRSLCEHDEKRRVFRITEPGGTTTEFHDRAVRFLVVCRDPESGELEPIIERGGPKVLYLCKEAGL